MNLIDRNGEIYVNNQGLNMKIIKYKNNADIDIQFENGYISKNKNYRNFKNGEINNLYFPNVCGVGYIGEGKYKPSIGGKDTVQYKSWYDILKRCYDEEYHIKKPTYIECKICEDWKNFQNSGKWYDENFYTIGNEKMQLDKDILIKGNKLYSSETCIFVPQRINSLFVKSDSVRGKFPIGVYYHKKANKFASQLNKNGENFYLGLFDTPEEAFEEYKIEKEKYIKAVADEYKGKIPQKLYDALYRYEVEITD